MGQTLFLLGAGFNVDANPKDGRIVIVDGAYSYSSKCAYPLVTHMAQICLGLSSLPLGKSVEDLFSDEIERGNFEPIKRLSTELMHADHRLAPRLFAATGPNSYQQFFARFRGSNFLTFNYDSFPEIILHNRGEWLPDDGFGVAVRVEHRGTTPGGGGLTSASLVLHLHGSFCLNRTRLRELPDSTETSIKLAPRSHPEFIFEPYSLAKFFPAYKSPGPQHGDVEMERRVIAPLRDKAPELSNDYFRPVYDRARELTHACGTIVAIGYSFSPHDAASYDPILQTLSTTSSPRLFVVAPDAAKVTRRLSERYPAIAVVGIEETLKSWAARSFRGISGE